MLAIGLVVAVSSTGCRCNGPSPSGDPTPAPAPSTSGTAGSFPEHDLHLLRTAIVAYGNTTPLPVSEEFSEPVEALRPPLERATSMRPNAPLRLRVARDVNYGQLTRLMQAALAYRVIEWDVIAEDASGKPRVVRVKGPGPLPRGNCFARAWVGPDARVQLGIDPQAVDGSPVGMTGVIVNPKQGAVVVDKVVDVVRRLDARCATGQVRLYSQPTARFGPVFDLAVGLDDASPRPHLSELMLAVPSLGPLDSPSEVY